MIQFFTKWLGWLCKWQGLPSWVAGLRLRRKALLWWWWLYPGQRNCGCGWPGCVGGWAAPPTVKL